MANKGTADLLRIFDKDINGTFDEATDSLEAIRDALDLSDTNIEAVLADTNEIQGDLADGGRLDLLVDAIKAKTDNLPVDPADESSLETAITTAESNIRGADSDTLKSLSDQIDGVGGGASAADVADAVWDEATSGHTDAGSFGKALQDLSGGGGSGSYILLNGACDVGMSGSTTSIVCADLADYGDDYFNDNWLMAIIKNANSIGAVPSGEIRTITDYASSSGTFTTAAFSANVEASDEIVVFPRFAQDDAYLALKGTIVDDESGATNALTTSISTPTTANAWGSWYELDASTEDDSYLFAISYDDGSFVSARPVTAISIGIGAAASETEIVKFSLVHNYTYYNGTTLNYLTSGIIYLPMRGLFIPSGTRIAARAAHAANGTASVISICVHRVRRN